MGLSDLMGLPQIDCAQLGYIQSAVFFDLLLTVLQMVRSERSWYHESGYRPHIALFDYLIVYVQAKDQWL